MLQTDVSSRHAGIENHRNQQQIAAQAQAEQERGRERERAKQTVRQKQAGCTNLSDGDAQRMHENVRPCSREESGEGLVA